MRVGASLFLGFLGLLFGSAACAQQGAYTLPASLDRLVTQSDQIIRGHVVSAVVEPHPQFPNLRTVVVTIRVDRTLKGAAESTVTFRQFLWDARDIANAGGYGKTEEYLLFLNPVSKYGLTSPVGLEQGRFRVRRDAKGNVSAMNGHGNVGLFTNVSAKLAVPRISVSSGAQAMLQSPRGGAAPLAALEETIQALETAKP
jgi:hypothetical protein